MAFLDLISVSPLDLGDVQEAASVLIAGHIRDPMLDVQFPRSQRLCKVTWQTRVDRVASTLSFCLSVGQIFMIAKYVPDNRIVGIISVYQASLATMEWDEPGSEALLEHNNFSGAFRPSEISPYIAGKYEIEHRRAIQKCGMKGSFWHDAGLCTLSEFEGKGVGYKLINTLYSRLARLSGGPRQVFVTTNSSSRRVFEDYGFKLSWTIRIDLTPITQSVAQQNSVRTASSPIKPKHFNEYCLTYDLSNVYKDSPPRQLSRPSPPLKFATEADETLVTLKQYNRIVRPVSSLADLQAEANARTRKRGRVLLRGKQK